MGFVSTTDLRPARLNPYVQHLVRLVGQSSDLLNYGARMAILCDRLDRASLLAMGI